MIQQLYARAPESASAGAVILTSLKSASHSDTRAAGWKVGNDVCPAVHPDSVVGFDTRTSPVYPFTADGLSLSNELCTHPDTDADDLHALCATGDLTTKHGKVSVASVDAATPATAAYTDISVSLHPGDHGILGRSLWIEFDDGETACADLTAGM